MTIYVIIVINGQYEKNTFAFLPCIIHVDEAMADVSDWNGSRQISR